MAFGRPKRNREPSTEAQLFEYALKSLGSRMRSVYDLKRLLKARAEPGPDGEDHIANVLHRLHELKYLSDPKFAADFTRLRQENQNFGRRRVQQDLQQKGIGKELIKETLDTAYEDINEAALARQYIERKRIKVPTDDKSGARVMRRLIRAGFSPQTVFKVLKAMRAPEEAIAMVESAEFEDASDAE